MRKGSLNICVGMSGGVDSSVVAALLASQGHKVTGIMMKIWDGPVAQSVRSACYGPDEAEDIVTAEKVCREIGIPFRVFDCSSEFKDVVIKNFRDEYMSARTPNPCVRCNARLKFGVLLDAAEKSGLQFDYFATGHYARIDIDPLTGRADLLCGVDPRKDQSYFLYRLKQEQLARAMFPLGGMTKGQVRELARSFHLSVSEKKESQDFYSGDYRDILGVEDSPGEIVLTNGKNLGHHGGFWKFTHGQRRGLGISSRIPLYVVGIDPEQNRVVAGTRDELSVDAFTVREISWTAHRDILSEFRTTVRVRSGDRGQGCMVSQENISEVRVTLDSVSDLIAPGQSAVFYDGERVIGGGVIDKIMSRSENRPSDFIGRGVS